MVDFDCPHCEYNNSGADAIETQCFREVGGITLIVCNRCNTLIEAVR